jgi:hypothetical protein
MTGADQPEREEVSPKNVSDLPISLIRLGCPVAPAILERDMARLALPPAPLFNKQDCYPGA